ncbi:phosphoenolpyruvate--protein phosphotransferase [Microbaculum marinum]|uniref:phosphoenolpyruvate--protein phosphotransferase n=1 Tax=Microbaculum marinum TaxID=1764581 RepID=A0AAW9RQH6_9HYPH
MRGSIGGPRVMLRRLRELMAEPVNAQERLDKIVMTIASNMVAEVCSVYVLRGDAKLELFATEGLKPESVHKSSLNLGEGLVGTIASKAEPLNLPNAQEHPAFAYLPETGEEIYQSFLGVPVLRGGQTLGVVVVQNRTQRSYSEEEVEALQTTAMVLAEMIAGDELDALVGPGENLALRRPQHLAGRTLSEGLGLGHAVLHEPRLVVTNLIAEDVDRELARLEAALDDLRTSVEDLLTRTDILRAGEHREVLEAYRMFAYDRGWAERIREAVRTGLTAEAAVERVQNDTRARMLRQTDPYLRDRLHDLDDLANRLLRKLVGWDDLEDAELPKDAILVARNMGPAELLDYDRERLRGLVLEEGAPTSHVTIVARALGLATVGQVEGILDLVNTGDPIIVDGISGEVHVRPPADVENAYVEKVRFRARRQEQYRQLKDTPAVTLDGQAISILVNAGLLVDLPHVAEAGAAGIGLFRTELQFMVAETLPRIREQQLLYRSVLDAAGSLPVTFRSLDVGGDKVLPYLRSTQEENPALGWRAIRMALDRPALLRTQIRGLLHAAAGREMRLMFPMITEVNEFDRARDLVDRERRHLERHGHAVPDKILLGAMVEVPSLLWQLEELVARVDFLSVGSNDLMQFLFAIDRTNSQLAERFDPLSPGPMRALRRIVEAAEEGGVPVTLCGELAGDPLSAMALLGIGYRSISMAPAAVGPVKAMVLSLDLGALESWLRPELHKPHTGLRKELSAYAQSHGVQI